MAAAVYYEQRSYQEDGELRPVETDLILLCEAESLLLRGLDSSLAVRNNSDVNRDVPTTCYKSLDWFCTYLESQPFESLRSRVSDYLNKRCLRQQMGIVSVTGEIEGKKDIGVLFPIPDVNKDAVVAQMLGFYGSELFGSVNSLSLRDLHSLPIEQGVPEDSKQQNRMTLRVLTAAILDLRSGRRLESSQPVEATGYRHR